MVEAENETLLTN